MSKSAEECPSTTREQGLFMTSLPTRKEKLVNVVYEMLSRRAFKRVGWVLLLAFIVEVLGWQIMHEQERLASVFSLHFIFSALHTFAGAFTMGLVFFAVGLMIHLLVRKSQVPLLLLWTIGALFFLLLMGGLVTWGLLA